MRVNLDVEQISKDCHNNKKSDRPHLAKVREWLEGWQRITENELRITAILFKRYGSK